MKPIVLIGYRQDISAYVAAARSNGREIAGIVDRFYIGKSLDGLPVLGSDLDLLDHDSEIYQNKDKFDWFVSTVFAGFTNTKNNNENTWLLRQERIKIAESAKVNLTNIIHSSAYVDPLAVLGKNIFVGWVAYIGAYCNIGDYSFIGGYVGLAHHVICGKNCALLSTTGVIGNIEFGENVYVGPGCTISRSKKSSTTIGNNVLIAPGTTVMRSIPNDTVVFSNGRTRANQHFKV